MVKLKPREHIKRYEKTPEYHFATIFYRHLTDCKFSTRYGGEIIVQIPKIVIPKVKIIRNVRNNQTDVKLFAVKSSTFIEYWDSQSNREGEVEASFGEASYLWGIDAAYGENEVIDPDLRLRMPQLEDALGFSFTPGRLFSKLLREEADLYYSVYFDSDNSNGEVLSLDEIQKNIDKRRSAIEKRIRRAEQDLLNLERKLRARRVVK